jgi:hypothetical protein
VSESLTALVIVAAVAWSAWCLWKPNRFSPFQIALLGNLLFVLGTAAITALGRSKLGGLEGATAIRYQTPALVFWASFAMLIAVSVNWNPPLRLLVFQATLLILTVAGGGRWVDMGRVAEARQFVEEVGWNAIARADFSDPALRDIYPEPTQLKPLASFLRDHGWGPGGEITSFARLQNGSGQPQISGYHIRLQACVAHWDRAQRSGLRSVSVGGWALAQESGQTPRRVAFASGDGKIVGFANVTNVRQDVAGHYPSAKGVKTGWETNLSVPGDGVYHAFLVVEGQRTACPTGGELLIRDYPVF